MWPWEHLAIAYLSYSLGRRASTGQPPSGTETGLLAVASQGPDLVDKPLSWGLGIFPTGYAIGHSVFVAGPLGVGALVGGYRVGRFRTAAAVVVGYWSHLVADVVSPVQAGGSVDVRLVLWPIVSFDPYGTDLGVARGFVYLVELIESAGSVSRTTLVVRYLSLPLAVFALWLVDGAPGSVRLRRRIRSLLVR